jgi:L-asparaginase
MTVQGVRARVLVLSLGGTIASTAVGGAGVVPQLSASDLLEAVPEIVDVADITAMSVRQIPSGNLTFADLVEVARIIRDQVADGVDGVVVTQGTDTIEETSFVLDVVLDTLVPVVVTGAMRNPTVLSSDGPGNLLTAVRVAASPAAHGLGCLVVMNEQVHAARFVRKMHSSNLAAFHSPSSGPLGWVAEERVRIVTRVSPLATIALSSLDETPAVALVSCAWGDDGRTLSSLAQLGYRGAVLEAFGAGHVASTLVEPLDALAASMPVVLCSRTGAGEVLAHTYGYAGSEMDLLSRGLLSGGVLDARKSRVALTLALAAAPDTTTAIEHFVRVRDSMSDGANAKESSNDPRGTR